MWEYVAVMWNELSYELQLKVISLIQDDLLLKQTDIDLQDGLVAALAELETWSNSPCPISEDYDEYPYVAQAVDQEDLNDNDN